MNSGEIAEFAFYDIFNHISVILSQWKVIMKSSVWWNLKTKFILTSPPPIPHSSYKECECFPICAKHTVLMVQLKLL